MAQSTHDSKHLQLDSLIKCSWRLPITSWLWRRPSSIMLYYSNFKKRIDENIYTQGIFFSYWGNVITKKTSIYFRFFLKNNNFKGLATSFPFLKALLTLIREHEWKNGKSIVRNLGNVKSHSLWLGSLASLNTISSKRKSFGGSWLNNSQCFNKEAEYLQMRIKSEYCLSLVCHECIKGTKC